MGFKKYMPSFTQGVQIVIVIVLATATGVLAWVQAKAGGIFGRFR